MSNGTGNYKYQLLTNYRNKDCRSYGYFLACLFYIIYSVHVYIYIYMCVYIVFSFLPLLYYLIKGLLLVVSLLFSL